jgi:hypothetical protein
MYKKASFPWKAMEAENQKDGEKGSADYRIRESQVNNLQQTVKFLLIHTYN